MGFTHIYGTSKVRNEVEMKLMILGSGTCVPTAHRRSPGYFVDLDGSKLLFDSGSGTLFTLAQQGINYAELDGVFYTHFHLDHTLDLLTLLFALTNDHTCARTTELTIYGPVGMQAFVDNFYKLFDSWIKPKKVAVLVRELRQDDQIIFDNGTVKAYRVPHMETSLGYRITSQLGKVMVLSGDTGYGKEVVDLARDADLAIFECAFSEEWAEKVPHVKHLTPTMAGKLAQQAMVKTLVLTHIYPDTDKIPLLERCKKEFAGDVTIAQDLMVFEI